MSISVIIPGTLQPDGTLRLEQTPNLPPGPVVVTVEPAAHAKATENGSAQSDASMVADRFEKLASDWRTNTRFLSNVTAKILNADYQKIIGMGKDAVPCILNDLAENGPNDWFWALTAITDVNPITSEIAGNMNAMTEAWLQWGTQAGYLKDYPRATKTSSRT